MKLKSSTALPPAIACKRPFRPHVAAITILVVSLVCSATLVWRSEQRRFEFEQAQVSDLAGDHAHLLQAGIERALSATLSLAALVREGKGDISDFEATAREMLPFFPGAASLQLAPGGILRHIVPLAGNEGAIGHDLFKDPARRNEAIKARDAGKLTLAGPFTLKQGGFGAVGRMPVYLDNGAGGRSFWGFTNVLIRFPQVLDSARLANLEKRGFRYELWRLHPDTGKRQIIAASSSTPLIKPVDRSLELPNGTWTLSVAPSAGWSDPGGLAIKSALALVFSLLLFFLTHSLFNTRAKALQIAQKLTSELCESEQRYRLVFENSPVSIWEEDFSGVKTLLDGLKQEGVTDIEAHFEQHPETIQQCARMAKIVDVNEAALVLHGAASKEALLAGLVGTFTSESFDTFREELICLWNGANVMMRDAVVKTLAGDRRNVTVYFAVCPGYEKTLGKVIVSLVDITERKRAEKGLRHSEARLNEAQRTAHLGNWELDLASNTLHWSDEIYRIFEIDQEQFGASYDAFLEAIHPEDREMVNRAYTQSLADRTPYGIVHRLLMKDGRIKYVEEHCETFYAEDDRPLRSMGTVQDITKIKLAEKALYLQTVELEAEVAERQVAQENLQEQALLLENEIEEHRNARDELEALNESLEERVKERTADLERANSRLLELDRMKSMFIASMSHELRTPLNSTIGFSRILLDEWAGPLNDEQRENLDTILKSGKHLLALVNDVIDVSRIEAGKIEVIPRNFDIHECVSEAAASFGAIAEKKGVEIKLHAVRHPMRSDRIRLLQCLLNLVSNAVKFTEKGTITICAKVTDDDDRLEISVTDTGIGIREEDLGKLFSPFVRLESPLASTVPGTGLGLYLTRKLAKEVLQGAITVQSTHGVGSRFVLRIPINL